MRVFLASGSVTSMMPGRSAEMTGACPGSTVNSPSTPGTTTCATSSESAIRSGVTSSNLNVPAMYSVRSCALPSGLRLGVDLFRRLHLGAAERAEEHRMINHVGVVLLLRVHHADRHVEDAVVVRRDQRLELLALQHILENFAAAAELARAICRHALFSLR